MGTKPDQQEFDGHEAFSTNRFEFFRRAIIGH